MRLLQALGGEPLDRPPIWFMRQAGRYLPEYRELRSRFTFEKAVATPKVAAEITLQPVRRFPLDAAIVFADIMTPLGAMGVEIEFNPGPKLGPLTLDGVAGLKEFDPGGVEFVSETIALVRHSLDDGVAAIGFCGGPLTLLAYLLEGGGSQHFPTFRRNLHAADPTEALAVLARAMRGYLQAQVTAGAQVVQMFDSWAGLLQPGQYERWAVPAAREALADLGVPTIYFAPAAAHLLKSFPLVGATAYGVDWRLPLDRAWRKLGDSLPIQGNLDPALLLSNPDAVEAGTLRVLEQADSRPGHVFNLGHGVMPDTPVPNVDRMVKTVLGWRDRADAGVLNEARQIG